MTVQVLNHFGLLFSLSSSVSRGERGLTSPSLEHESTIESLLRAADLC
jgi:hypothetical protein